jgi:hypothetical protein
MREFVLTSTGVSGMTIVGAPTLNFIHTSAAPNVDIGFMRHWVGQTPSVVSVMQEISLMTQVTAFPTVVSQAPRSLKMGDPTVCVIVGGTAGAAGTCGINASAEGAGAKTLVWPDTFNVVNGYLKVNTPEEREIAPAGYAAGVNLWLSQTPTTLTGWIWGQSFFEIA